jgi:hypothetical protein
MKIKKSKVDLCINLPKSIFSTFEYISKIKSANEINYKYLISMFRT